MSIPNQKMMIFHYDLLILPFLGFGLFVALREKLPRPSQSFFLIAFALVGFGYSPIFELTRRLPYIDRIPSVLRLHRIETTEPVTADSKILAHLNHLPNTRWLKVPESDKKPAKNSATFWKNIVELNPKSRWIDQGRDIADSKILIVNRLNPSELKMEADLGPFAMDLKDLGKFAVLKFNKPILDIICERFSACRPAL
jgi:hypothetical protein